VLYDLLVLAELNPDVVVACTQPVRFGQVEQLVDRAAITLGSSGAITAAAAAALGLRVGVCAVVGDDDLADVTVNLLAKTGVDIAGVVRRRGMRTGMTVVLTRPDGDRALLTFPGTMGELSAADIADVTAARHVHVSSFYLQTALQEDLPGLFAAARAHGATTSIDPGWDPAEQWAAIVPTLPAVDVLLPNAAECSRIAAVVDEVGSNTDRVLEAAQALRAHGPTVAVKLGAEGAAVVSEDGVVRVAARPVVPIDTTGAGDNFDAGFLSAHLSGASVGHALARGVACGTFSVAGWGGTGALASAHQADALAAELQPSAPLAESRSEEQR
jgi:ribokinase